MPNAEKINTAPQETHEHETTPVSDTLRRSLLSAPEDQGGYNVMIPRNTVVVEMNSSAINEGLFQDLSGLVEDLKEEPVLSSSGSAQKRGFGKLGVGSYMASIDHAVRSELKKTVNAPNLTFLYDGSNVDIDGNTLVPSAILVHENMSDQQIQELRDKLPAGVPLIDGKTNRLLDEVGQAEREQGRRYSRIIFGFGHLALNDTVETTASTPRRRRGRGLRVVFDWDAAEKQVDDGTPVAAVEAAAESAEVQAHARAQEIITEKTGGRNWSELEPAEQRSVRRQVVRETHPDFEGGDVKVFRAAQDSMNLKSRESEE